MRPAVTFLLAIGGMLLLSGGQASAAESESPAPVPLAKDSEYALARRALSESLPGVAIEKLRELLEAKPPRPAAERAALKILLLESFVRQGLAAEALELSADKELPGGHATDFWRAQAMAASGLTDEAVALFAASAADPQSPFRAEAAFSRANLLFGRGDTELALATLEPLFDDADPGTSAGARLRAAEIYFGEGENKSAGRQLENVTAGSAKLRARTQFLRGRMALTEERWSDAEKIFAPLVNNPEGQPPALHHAGYLALADAYAGRGEANKAERVLKAFLEKYPTSKFVDTAFQRLDRLGMFSKDVADPDLTAWAESPQTSLKIGALYYLALTRARKGDAAGAIASLNVFVAEHADHPLQAEALLRLSGLYHNQGDWKNALASLEAIRKKTGDADLIRHLDFLKARTQFASGDMKKAAKEFTAFREASGDDPEAASAAAFNAALAAVQLDDLDGFASNEGFLRDRAGELRSDLLLQQALFKAGQSSPEAVTYLTDFVRKFPDHAELARAHIALAELAFLAFPPKPVTAHEHLELARDLPHSSGQAEQMDYIGIWVAESAGDTEQAIALGKSFIDQWPKSPRIPEMRMKLGEIYLNQDDYPNAVAEFEHLAQEVPGTPLAETALFFAGKAARLTMNPKSIDRAIEIWARVVDIDGRLALAAREQQALAKMDTGKEEEAVAVFDSILGHDPPAEGDLRYSVLCSKGQALFVTSSKNSSLLPDAIASFDEVIADEKASSFWRNQARVRKAKCYEKRGDRLKALETYYDVLNDPAREPGKAGDEPTEFLWYYRAGFEAIRLLESDRDVRAAIGVADRLARSGGGRDQEAAQIAKRLRLEHFVWDEEKAAAPSLP